MYVCMCVFSTLHELTYPTEAVFATGKNVGIPLVTLEDFLADGSDHDGYELQYWTG